MLVLQLLIFATIFAIGYWFVFHDPLSKGLFGGRLKKRKDMKRGCRSQGLRGRDLQLCLLKAKRDTLHEGSRKHSRVTRRYERREDRRDDIRKCDSLKGLKKIACKAKANLKKRR